MKRSECNDDFDPDENMVHVPDDSTIVRKCCWVCDSLYLSLPTGKMSCRIRVPEEAFTLGITMPCGGGDFQVKKVLTA